MRFREVASAGARLLQDLLRRAACCMPASGTPSAFACQRRRHVHVAAGMFSTCQPPRAQVYVENHNYKVNQAARRFLLGPLHLATCPPPRKLVLWVRSRPDLG